MTEKTLDYAGGRAIYHLVRDLAECLLSEYSRRHSSRSRQERYELVERAVDIGFIGHVRWISQEICRQRCDDKRVVDLCHSRDVCVQGELGSVPYIGEASTQTIIWEEYMTDPEEACRFVEKRALIRWLLQWECARIFSQSVPNQIMPVSRSCDGAFECRLLCCMAHRIGMVNESRRLLGSAYRALTSILRFD